MYVQFLKLEKETEQQSKPKKIQKGNKEKHKITSQRTEKQYN